MPAIALTDHGNLYGAFTFIGEAVKNNIKPIIGCEFYVALERTRKKFTKDNPDVTSSPGADRKKLYGLSEFVAPCHQ